MSFPVRRQRSAQVLGRIVFRPPRGNRIAKRCGCNSAMPASIRLTLQDIYCRQLRDRPAPDPGEKIQLEATNDLFQMTRRPGLRKLVEPLPSHRFERIAARASLRPPPRRWIDAGGERA